MQVILLSVIKTLLMKLLTEAFLGKVLVAVLEGLVTRTTNKVDDQLVSAMKDAFSK